MPHYLISSDAMHNMCCFNYLKNLSVSQTTLDLLKSKNKPLYNQFVINVTKKGGYNTQYPYGDLYHHLIKFLDSHIDRIYQEATPTQKLELDKLIYSIFVNDSYNLELIYGYIKDIPLLHSPAEPGIKRKVTRHFATTPQKINQCKSPVEFGGQLYDIQTSTTDRFRPQAETSIPVLRHFNYLNRIGHNRKEIRLGTQGQRVSKWYYDPFKLVKTVSPLFLRFVQIQPSAPTTSRRLAKHVYFNYLSLDDTAVKKSRENGLTQTLHAAETGDKSNSFLLITLPAIGGLLKAEGYKKNPQSNSIGNIAEEFFNIASQNGKARTSIKDFKISPFAERLIYSGQNKNRVIRELLNNSFRAMGYDINAKGRHITFAEQQAIWYHFAKFELPNYILERINPETYNFTCKDGIDRGGAASAYYNLFKSFETDTPLSRCELEKALHAAPTLVKGRGMNESLHILWNAVDIYLKHNGDRLIQDPQKAWLLTWHALNTPKSRIQDVLASKIVFYKKHAPTEGPKGALYAKLLNKCSKTLGSSDQAMQGKMLELLGYMGNAVTQRQLSIEDNINLSRYVAKANTKNLPLAKTARALEQMVKSSQRAVEISSTASAPITLFNTRRARLPMTRSTVQPSSSRARCTTASRSSAMLTEPQDHIKCASRNKFGFDS